MKKICNKCKVEKDVTEFYKDKSKKDGISIYCKSCSDKNVGAWRLSPEQKEKRNAKQKERLRLKRLDPKFLTEEQIRMRRYRYVRTLEYKFSQYKTRAEPRGYNFELTIDQFSELINKPCHYCGTLPVIGTLNGVDRKDNNIGYIVSNCLPCCKVCNWAKRTYSYEEFTNWIHTASKHLIKSSPTVEPIHSEIPSKL